MIKEEKALHVLIDVNFEEFSNDLEKIEFWSDLGARVLAAGNFQILKKDFHKFQPQGITGFWLLAESHFAVHTWPESRHVCFDLFSCGDNKRTRKSVDILISEIEKVGGKIEKKKEIERGYVYKED